jgi:hypothetical protein
VTSDFMSERDQPASQEREAFNRYHGQLGISLVSLMELIYGAEKSASLEKICPL